MAETIQIKFETNFAELNKTIKGLNKSITKLNSTISSSSKDIAKQTSKTTDSFKEQAVAISSASEQASKYSEAINEVISIAKKVGFFLLKAFLANENFFTDLAIGVDVFVRKIKTSLMPIVNSFISLIQNISKGNKIGSLFNLNDIRSNTSDAIKVFGSEFDKLKNTIKGKTDSTFKYFLDKLSEVSAALISAGLSVASMGRAFPILGDSIDGITNNLKKLGKVILSKVGIAKLGSSLASFGRDASKTSSKLFGVVASLDRGFFGLVSSAQLFAAVLVPLGDALRGSENGLTRFAGSVIFLSGIAIGGLSVALAKLTGALGQIALSTGNKVVKFTQKLTKNFIKAEQKAFVFKRTIQGFNKAFGHSAGTIKTWNKLITDLSSKTGDSAVELRKAATEIVATTSAMGLNRDQAEKLLRVTTDYASFMESDVLSTTIQFISALNGNAQSVQKYGVKLSQASVQQKLFSKGLNVNFNNLSGTEKVQKRYQSLLSQYVPIAGLAAAKANTLAGQQKVFTNNTERLNLALAKGTSIIENQTIVQTAANFILNSINDKVATATGLFVALGGRILQVGGFFLKWSVTILSVTKAYALLNIMLASTTVQAALNTKITLLGGSFANLATILAGTTVRLTSAAGVFKFLTATIVLQSKLTIAAISGVNVASLSLSGVLLGTLKRALAITVIGLQRFNLALFSLLRNPIVLKIAAIAAAIYLTIKAIKAIEKETKVFSLVIDSLSDSLSLSGDTLKIIAPLFAGLGNVLKTILGRAIGLVVIQINALTLGFVKLLRLKPFERFFSAEAQKKLQEADLNLTNYSKTLLAVGLDTFKVGKAVERSVAQINKSAKSLDLKPFFALQEELKNVGKSDLSLLKEQQEARLKIVNDRLSQGIVSTRAANDAIAKINLDFFIKRKELLERESTKVEKEQNKQKKTIKANRESLEDIFRNPIQFIVGQKDFKKSLSGIGETLKSSFGKLFSGSGLKGFVKNIGKGFKTAFKNIKKSDLKAVGAGMLGNLTKGAEGVRKTMVSAVTGAASAMFGPFGQLIGQVFDMFTQGPEHTRKMIREIHQAVPEIIQNVVESIPVFIEESLKSMEKLMETVAEKFDVILIGIVNSLPSIAVSLVKHIAFQMPFQLVKAFPKMAISFVKAIVKEFPAALIRESKNIGNGFMKGIKEAFSKIGNIFTKMFKFDGKGKGPVEKFLHFDFPWVKFAKGGVVPGKAMFNGDSEANDKVPALLSPGEVVIPRSAMNGGTESIAKYMKEAGVPGFGFGKIFKKVVSTVTRGADPVQSTLSSIIGDTGSLGKIKNSIFDQLAKVGSKFGLNIDVLNAVESLRNLGASISLTDVVKDPKNIITTAAQSIKGVFRPNLKEFMSAGLPKLQQGGTIPNGFSNDNFFAGLSSGENVLPQRLNDRLDGYIDSSTQTQQVNQALLAQLVDIVSRPQTVNSQVMLNNETFANIILNLSRDNQRLA